LTGIAKILFDHIAIAVPAMSQAAPFLAGELGGVPDAGCPSMARAFTWGTYAYEGGGSIEVLEPLGASGFLHRFLAERGPSIHHVTFKVPSLDEISARAEAVGYDVVGRDDSDPEWREAFLHPKQALGIVVQFAQPGPSDGTAFTPPPGVSAPPSPVTVLGLRMRCQSRERAITQWSTVLQGTMMDGPQGSLVFRWPGSFMRLAVEIDPVQNEGPIAIELTSARRLTLPAGPHPLLGTVFEEEA
jgi:methylmalonyl-CoA/ethylmalonyl-CoA epimerase